MPAKNRFLITVCFLLFPIFGQINAQSAKTYFQQRSNYTISVKLDDQRHMISGSVDLEYLNNSPDTLTFIWFHLWPNAYANRSTPLCNQMLLQGNTSLFFADQKDRGWLDSLEFKSGENKLQVIRETINSEMVKVILSEPILPGKSQQIRTTFRVKIPDARFSRLGCRNDAFYLTQWYPKPAVYDYEGWHPMPNLNFGEFYSEFGSFNVSISVPENYVVAASGELLDESEKVEWRRLDSISRATPTALPFRDSIASSAKYKTLHFKIENAHDFAWFADKRFYVLLDTVKLKSGKQVSTAVFFTGKKSGSWIHAPDYARSGLQYLSDEVGDYPYETFSVIDGQISAGGGMEYPSATILNSPSGDGDLERVLIHELGHNWFYGALGSNERTHPFMDEGINSYYETRYMKEARVSTSGSMENIISGTLASVLGVKDLDEENMNELALKLASFDNSDQPVCMSSEYFTSFNYGVIVYMKTARAFEFLYDYLGKDLAKKCISDYYLKWKFKHPDPVDLRKSFENTCGSDLGWFFDELLCNTDPLIPSRIQKINAITGQSTYEFKLKSGPEVPFKIERIGDYKWITPEQGTYRFEIPDSNDRIIFFNKDYTYLLKTSDYPIHLGSGFRYPKYKLHGFPKIIDQPGTENLYLLPAAGWNSIDQTMLGIYFSNKDLIPEKLEFSVLPLWSIKRNKLSGIGDITFKIWPVRGIFREIAIFSNFKSFGFDHYSAPDFKPNYKDLDFDYKRLSSGFEFVFRKGDMRNKTRSSFKIRNILIIKDGQSFEPENSTYIQKIKSITTSLYEAQYVFTDLRVIDPYSIAFNLQQGSMHTKLSTTFNYRFSYKMPKKGLDIRFFCGAFAYNQTITENYNFRMSGWNGKDDYLFDGIFPGKSESQGFWSQQMLMQEGAFKCYTPLGQSGKWIASMNVSADIPVPLPISVFGSLGTYEGINKIYDDLNNKVMLEGGISIRLIKNALELHIPLMFSDDIKRNLELNNVKFAERIRFVMDLNQISFTQLRNRIIDQNR